MIAEDVRDGPRAGLLAWIGLWFRARPRCRGKSCRQLLASDVAHVLSATKRVIEADRISIPVPVRPLTQPVQIRAEVPPALPLADALGRDAAELLAHLLATLDASRNERTGLSFVPAIVTRLGAAMSVAAAHALLLAAARRELIELRPEGGLGRLSVDELALCPPGPSGTRLSWARRHPGVGA